MTQLDKTQQSCTTKRCQHQLNRKWTKDTNINTTDCRQVTNNWNGTQFRIKTQYKWTTAKYANTTGVNLIHVTSISFKWTDHLDVKRRNRRFPEITGEDNLTVFSYSRRVKSEWRWQRRIANLRHFEIFRHGPIIIYSRLPAGGTYYPLCTFPASSECLIGISDAFSAFCLRVSVILPTCSLYPQQKHACSALHPQVSTYIYKSMPEGSYQVQSPGFPKIVYLKMLNK